jgi:hypothetical protein
MKNIKQIVVEVHHAYQSPELWKVLDKLTRTHWLYHFKPHNGCGFIEGMYMEDGIAQRVKVPRLYEGTYVLKDHPPLNSDDVPSSLDEPNSPQVPDLMNLYGYPFTTRTD